VFLIYAQFAQVYEYPRQAKKHFLSSFLLSIYVCTFN